MEGKTILVISAGNDARQSVWASFKTFGIRVILVDKDENNHGIHQVDKFYQYDFSNHLQDETHKENIIKALASEHIDGCFTFTASCVVLTAMICEKLTLPGGNVAAAQLINNKYDYLQVLKSIDVTRPYASEGIEIKNVKDVEAAPKDFPFPAVIKPIYGSGSACVKKVENKEEAVREYVRIQEEHYSKPTYGRATNGFSNGMILMEFIEGTKHEVDVVIFNGVQIVCVITDYALPVTERFLYSCYQLPSQLPVNQQIAIATATDEIRKTIGISDGSLNFEFRLTNAGPRLIEVNGRIGMFHRKENIIKCYDIDILKFTVQACLGLTTLPISLTPKIQLVAVLCYPSLHGEQLQSVQVQQYLKELELKGNFQVIPHSTGFNRFEQPACCISFYDNDIEKAKSRLLTMFDVCEMDSPGYDIRGLLNSL